MNSLLFHKYFVFLTLFFNWMSEKDNPQQQALEMSDVNIKSDMPINRRTVLKSMSTGIAVSTSIAAVGTSMATPLDNEYDATDVRQLLTNHEDLLVELASRGILESSSVEGLNIDSLSPPSPNDPDGERIVELSVDRKRWSELRISRQTDRGGLAIVVLIESNEAYASLNPPNTESPTIIKVNNTNKKESVAPTEYPWKEACEIPCPTDGPCCNCKQVCESGCNCRCTPVYVYECNCCALWPTKCAINCA